MFFSEDALSLELLGVFKIVRRDNFSEKHSYKRGYDSLSIRVAGKGEFCYSGKNLEISRGDVLYIPKNADYTQKTQGETVLAIHFINHGFKENLDFEILSVEDFLFVEQTFKKMYDIWKEKKQGHKLKCTALLYELLYFLNCSVQNEFLTSISTDTKIGKAIDYIHHNFRKCDIEISYLSELCAVSETYFRKLFKKIYSVSPKQYIINLRLEYASQLLKSQLYTVYEASEKSGFSDSKYFSRLFKKHFKVSPQKFKTLPPQ